MAATIISLREKFSRESRKCLREVLIKAATMCPIFLSSSRILDPIEIIFA